MADQDQFEAFVVEANLSLGISVPYASECSSSWATVPFSSLRAVGVTPVVASGNDAFKQGQFKEARKKYVGAQLADKTLGVIGLGRIGQEVAQRARAFQMRVIGFDPFISPERARELGIELFSNVKAMLP